MIQRLSCSKTGLLSLNSQNSGVLESEKNATSTNELLLTFGLRMSKFWFLFSFSCIKNFEIAFQTKNEEVRVFSFRESFFWGWERGFEGEEESPFIQMPTMGDLGNSDLDSMGISLCLKSIFRNPDSNFCFCSSDFETSLHDKEVETNFIYFTLKISILRFGARTTSFKYFPRVDATRLLITSPSSPSLKFIFNILKYSNRTSSSTPYRS